jgi:hypothetical protein
MPCLISIICQNSWIIFEAHMVSTIYGFNDSWLSCKKKYKTILMVYRNDKRMHEISKQGKLLEYKWFHQIDWRKMLKIKFPQVPQNKMSHFVSLRALISKPHKQDKKTSLTNTNKLEWFMEQVITNNKELVATFQVTLALLKSMDSIWQHKYLYFFIHSCFQFQLQF